MKRKGFFFACPTLTNDKDGVLELQPFIKVPTIDSDRIYNPFPQTAYAGNYNQACTHPLLYLSYLPAIDYKQIQNPKKRILASYYNLVTLEHELTHIVLHDTPAKMLARQVLAWAYADLFTLLYGKSWNKGSWISFEELNNQLTAICEAITPSEELLATAAGFEKINSIWREIFEEGVKALQKELENVEKQSINAHHNPLPDFADLYYNTFKKIEAWDNLNNRLEKKIAWYLQGIQQIHPNLEIVDSYSRCKNLAEKVKDMKNDAELENWIAHAVSEDEHVLHVMARAFLIGYLNVSYKFTGETRSWFEFRCTVGSYLWTLWQGSLPPIWEHTPVEIARNDTLNTSGMIIHLIPHETDEGWFIYPRIDNKWMPTPAQEHAARELLLLEAIRQQLDDRKGICCPNYMPGRCQCKLSWRKALCRLVQWAREDKFGSGDWRDLPPECRCGT